MNRRSFINFICLLAFLPRCLSAATLQQIAVVSSSSRTIVDTNLLSDILIWQAFTNNPPFLAISGDSIPANTAGGGISNQVTLAIGDGSTLKTVQNAEAGQTWSWVASTGIPAVMPYGPAVVFIHCGGNDINASRTWPQVAADMDTIRALTTNCLLIIDQIQPHTDWDDTKAGTLRLWNNYYSGWCSSNRASICPTFEALGQLRVSTGYKDDLATGYDSGDGHHPNAAGVAVEGQVLAGTLMALKAARYVPVARYTNQGTPASITSSLAVSGTVNSAFTYTITASGDTPITFTCGSLPDGLSFSSPTISGTPTIAATTGVTITATNAFGGDSQSLSITINPENTLTNDLVGHWKFDDGSGTTATDSSTNGINGTLNGGPTWTTGAPNLSGALSFDGGDDRVNITQQSYWSSSTTRSVSFWINPTSLSLALSYSRLLANASSANDTWEIMIGNAQGLVPGGIVCLNVVSGTADTRKTTTGLITTGSWYHIVVIFNTSQATAVYINGDSKSLSTDSFTTTYTTGLCIGNRADLNRGFNGIIDDVRIYNRTLTTDEIAALYSMGL